MVFVVNAGVVNDPVVLVLPPGAVHEVLLVDVQLRLVVAPYAIEDCDAVRVTVGLSAVVWFDKGEVTGASVSNVVDPPPPPHDASVVTANNTKKMALNMTFKLGALMRDITQFLH